VGRLDRRSAGAAHPGADACVPRQTPIRPEPPFLGHGANVPLAHLRNWALDNITRLLNLNPAGTAP
jgi:hypothetical protein